ncbi:MAG: DUF3341 domain-containing protein [Myxococcota bacterium]|nr:DUF3341 domain-containing protein [Myxococcota bacterium]
MNAVFYENKVQNGSVKAVFSHLDSLVYAIDELKREKLAHEIVVTTPLPRHDVEHVIYKNQSPSPVRWFTLFGALFGGTMGFSLCSITHLNWAMIIPAGKPLVSIPAFIVITFESTVLWGCLFTLFGLLAMCRLPASDLQIEVQDPRLSDDKFALVLNSLKKSEAAKAMEIIQKHHPLNLTNGYEQEKPEKIVIPLEDRGFEPDETNTDMLAKLGIAVTVLVVATVFGVRAYFDYTLAEELSSKDYNYSQKAIAPSYRTVK